MQEKEKKDHVRRLVVAQWSKSQAHSPLCPLIDVTCVHTARTDFRSHHSMEDRGTCRWSPLQSSTWVARIHASCEEECPGSCVGGAERLEEPTVDL